MYVISHLEKIRFIDKGTEIVRCMVTPCSPTNPEMVLSDQAMDVSAPTELFADALISAFDIPCTKIRGK
jgi:hypothetical protein